MNNDSLADDIVKKLFTKFDKRYSSCQPADKKKNIPLPYISRFPFITPHLRHEIVCSQYKYLTILTDGAIDPDANFNRQGGARNNLVIEFDNGDIWKIDSEIWNLNIERYTALFFTNNLFDIHLIYLQQFGYRNIYLILSVEQFPKFNKPLQPPHFCVNGEIEAGAGNALEWWAGKYRIAAGQVLLVPYLPLGYKDLRFQVSCTQLYNYTIWQYCCDDQIYCETTADVEANIVTCINIPIFSDRIYFRLVNRNLSDPGDYCMQGTWVRKGKF